MMYNKIAELMKHLTAKYNSDRFKVLYFEEDEFPESEKERMNCEAGYR